MQSEGWRPFYSELSRPPKDSPYGYDKVWIWRPEWQAPQLTVVTKMHPAMNVFGLLWRPVLQGAETLN